MSAPHGDVPFDLTDLEYNGRKLGEVNEAAATANAKQAAIANELIAQKTRDPQDDIESTGPPSGPVTTDYSD